MSSADPFILHSVTDVVTAEHHNPSLFNSDFLKRNKIVPESWEVSEAEIATPVVAQVMFKSGVTIAVDPERLSVTEKCESSFAERYKLHKVVSKLVGALPHVPYQALGLNARISMPEVEPRDWLVSRFLRAGKWSRGKPTLIGTSIKLKYLVNDAKCSLTFHTGKTRGLDGDLKSAIIIDSNFHHPSARTSSEIKAILKAVGGKQEFLVQTLRKLLVRPLT